MAAMPHITKTKLKLRKQRAEIANSQQKAVKAKGKPYQQKAEIVSHLQIFRFPLSAFPDQLLSFSWSRCLGCSQGGGVRSLADRSSPRFPLPIPAFPSEFHLAAANRQLGLSGIHPAFCRGRMVARPKHPGLRRKHLLASRTHLSPARKHPGPRWNHPSSSRKHLWVARNGLFPTAPGRVMAGIAGANIHFVR